MLILISDSCCKEVRYHVHMGGFGNTFYKIEDIFITEGKQQYVLFIDTLKIVVQIQI